jgi:signal transduction histidine kinase
VFFLLLGIDNGQAKVDYDHDSIYLVLRDSMSESFNNADEVRFSRDIKKLEDYLLQKGDMHGYYTQRCNEIVFMMNTQKIFEAYKASRKLSEELREKKLDKEMYMAHNMLGHIYRYCGNEEEAKKSFRQVIELMEKSGYRESTPPIYMNIVGVLEDDDPQEALKLLDEAKEIAMELSPERVFDIETRRTLIYYRLKDYEKFEEGYKAYKEGKAKGLSSVHGRSLEVYHEAFLGHTDAAVKMAHELLGEDSHATVATIYKDAGRWHEAYDELVEESKQNDSIYNIILTNSMTDFRNELSVYDLERQTAKARTITLTIIIALLGLLVAALTYITRSRRRHMKQLQKAYSHALESDKMKTVFIKNMSHEIRTPLNIISGFAQVIANPALTTGVEERRNIANMMLGSTRTITNLIDEMLELSLNESTDGVQLENNVDISDLLSDLMQENEGFQKSGVKLVFDNQLPPNFIMTTNKEMLKRIVNALLDNAFKFTAEGSVTLRASTHTEMLEIVVEDTGCGIPAEETNHIFERFVKLDDFKEGLGLGLPLSRMIAKRLHGYLIYDQHYTGQGSRFVFSLPLSVKEE